MRSSKIKAKFMFVVVIIAGGFLFGTAVMANQQTELARCEMLLDECYANCRGISDQSTRELCDANCKTDWTKCNSRIK